MLFHCLLIPFHLSNFQNKNLEAIVKGWPQCLLIFQEPSPMSYSLLEARQSLLSSRTPHFFESLLIVMNTCTIQEWQGHEISTEFAKESLGDQAMRSRVIILTNNTWQSNRWSCENVAETAVEMLESQRCRNVQHLQRIALNSVKNCPRKESTLAPVSKEMGVELTAWSFWSTHPTKMCCKRQMYRSWI